MVYKPDVKFNFYEPNFNCFFDLDLLKKHFSKIDYKDELHT